MTVTSSHVGTLECLAHSETGIPNDIIIDYVMGVHVSYEDAARALSCVRPCAALRI